MIKEYIKEVMHNVIAYQLLTNAQPVPEQWLLPCSQFPPVLLFSVTSYGMV